MPSVEEAAVVEFFVNATKVVSETVLKSLSTFAVS